MLRSAAARIAWLSPLVALLLASACADDPSAPTAVAAIELTPATLTLASGATGSLAATLRDDQGRELDGRSITWLSTNTEVATVSAAGLVTAAPNRALAPVTTTIIAAADGQVSTAIVTVLPAATARLRLSPEAATLAIGTSVELTAAVEDASGAELPGRRPTFTSLDTTVAAVSTNGVVTARDYLGPETRTARIVATADGRSDTSLVTVLPFAVASVELLPGPRSLVQGQSLLLQAAVRGADGRLLSGRSLTWVTSDTALLQLSATGLALAPVGLLDGEQPVEVTAWTQGFGDTDTLWVGSGFELAANGVTITCTDAPLGSSGRVNGVTYVKRDRAALDSLLALAQYAAMRTACTSGITDMSYLFAGQTTFNERIASWDVSSVTGMDAMFSVARSFNQPLEHWDVRNVTRMEQMFQTAQSFNQPLGAWDTRNVITMRQMFEGASDFNQPLNSWNVSLVWNMRSMFRLAREFNQPLNAWDVGRVNQMGSMFAQSGFNQPLDAWDVSRVIDMSEMFLGSAFNHPIGNWNVGNVQTMARMFESNTSFNQPIGDWNVSSVQSMERMFRGATAFVQTLGNWDVANVTTMARMFENASAFNADLSGWCVQDIGTAPELFDAGATGWTFPRPAWGSCSATSLRFSTITATPNVLPANDTALAQVVVLLRDWRNIPVLEEAPVLRLSTPGLGMLGSLTNEGNGRFSATFRAGATPATLLVIAELDGPEKSISVPITLTPP